MRERIQGVYNKLKQREQRLFEKCVKLIERGEIARAIVYSEEIAFIRRIKQKLKTLIQQ